MSGPWTDPEGVQAPTEEFRAVGRHASSQGPTTGPIHRAVMPPGGRHQETDLEPKRWPWLIALAVTMTLAGGGGYVWGQDIGAVAAKEEILAEASPVPAVTVTETAKARPRPRTTVTETVAGKAPAATPRPTVTVTETSAPAPGRTVYRTASPSPRPTVTKTRTIEIMVCFRINRAEEAVEAECP